MSPNDQNGRPPFGPFPSFGPSNFSAGRPFGPAVVHQAGETGDMRFGRTMGLGVVPGSSNYADDVCPTGWVAGEDIRNFG